MTSPRDIAADHFTRRTAALRRALDARKIAPELAEQRFALWRNVAAMAGCGNPRLGTPLPECQVVAPLIYPYDRAGEPCAHSLNQDLSADERWAALCELATARDAAVDHLETIRHRAQVAAGGSAEKALKAATTEAQNLALLARHLGAPPYPYRAPETRKAAA